MDRAIMDHAMDHPIAVILPPREGFSEQAFGAVSLSVKDFTLHSRYRHRTIVLGMRDEPPFEGIAYEALPVCRHWWEPNTRAYVRSLVARLNQLQPALIEIHNRPLLARKLAGKVAAPLTLYLHNDPHEMKAAHTPRERAALLKQCAAIYCVSDWARGRFLEGVTHGAEKVHTVYLGVDTPPAPTHKHPHILFVGRMTPNKGGLEFAQSLASLLPNHPKWQGFMIGGRRHAVSVALSAYEQQIHAAMQQAGDRAHFEGFCPFDQTQQRVREAQIMVVPSRWEEPFGRTCLEAMAQGCAVITSGRGGLREIVDDAGVVLQEVTSDAIAQAIASLIAAPEQLAALQQAAYQRAQLFASTRCTERLDAIRDTLIIPPVSSVSYAA